MTRRPSLASAPSGLVLAEAILAELKALAQDTDLWEDSAWTTNEMLGRGTAFATMVLHAECPGDEGYRRFLDKHWQAAAGAKADATAFFVAREAAPRRLTLRTYSRLAYLAALPRFARALEGRTVALSEDRSWTWDHDQPTRAGRPLYRPAYVLHIDLTAAKPFKATTWLRTAAPGICHSADARADRCVSQLAEDADIPRGQMLSYSWHAAGVDIECDSEKIAQGFQQHVFADCVSQVVAGKTRHDPTRLRVTLP